MAALKKLKAKDEGLKNPTTLNDFRELMRSIMAEGKSRQRSLLSLSAEHRIKYDELEAESTKEARETRKRAAQASINTSSQTTDGKIIETKHTRWLRLVVWCSYRPIKIDDYKKVLSEAKNSVEVGSYIGVVQLLASSSKTKKWHKPF